MSSITFLPTLSPIPLSLEDLIFRKGGNFVWKFFDGKGGGRIAFRFKRVFAMNIHQFSEQGELVCNCIIVHTINVSKTSVPLKGELKLFPHSSSLKTN